MGKKASRRKRTRPSKKASETEAFYDDSGQNFAFIVGYTPGGMPYGLTHEEMERLLEWEKNPEAWKKYLEEHQAVEEREELKPTENPDDRDLPERDLPF